MNRLKVLLAEDCGAVAKQLRLLFPPHYQVTATVEDGYAMVGAWMMLKPDVIIADITMPQIDGIAAASWILKSDPQARVILVTVHREPALMRHAMGLGILGYVLKLNAGEDLLPAIEAALRGERYVSEGLEG